MGRTGCGEGVDVGFSVFDGSGVIVGISDSFVLVCSGSLVIVGLGGSRSSVGVGEDSSSKLPEDKVAVGTGSWKVRSHPDVEPSANRTSDEISPSMLIWSDLSVCPKMSEP